jgi:signal peptidase I
MLNTVAHWTKSAAVAFVFFLIIRACLVEAFKISAGTMENTLSTGDFLLADKVAFGVEIPGTGLHLPALREPRRGDVIAFKPSCDPRRSYVKGLVGVPRDTLEMHGKVLRLKGVQVS